MDCQKGKNLFRASYQNPGLNGQVPNCVQAPYEPEHNAQMLVWAANMGGEVRLLHGPDAAMSMIK